MAPGSPQTIQLGDIWVSDGTVHTPSGSFPLAGSLWQVQDYTRVERTTPTWAIVLAIIGAFFFLLGLLFLLAKEDRVSGYIQVSVIYPPSGQSHRVVLPATYAGFGQYIQQSVAVLEYMASQAR
jgi:hypothetical protein